MTTEINLCRTCQVNEAINNAKCKPCALERNRTRQKYASSRGAICECCSQNTYVLCVASVKDIFYGTLCNDCARGISMMLYNIENIYALAEFMNPVYNKEMLDSLKTVTPSRPDYVLMGVGYECRLEGCNVIVISDTDRRYCREHKNEITAIRRMNRATHDLETCCEVCQNTNVLVLDHCHDSGIVRGTLCSPCNSAAGHFNEDPEIFANIIRFLEEKNVPQ